jgi:MFS family permease
VTALALVVYNYSFARLVFVSGLDRRLPPLLTRLNTHRVPHAALWAQTLVAAAVTAVAFIAVPALSPGTALDIQTRVYTVLSAATTVIWCLSMIVLFVDVLVILRRYRRQFAAQPLARLGVFWAWAGSPGSPACLLPRSRWACCGPATYTPGVRREHPRWSSLAPARLTEEEIHCREPHRRDPYRQPSGRPTVCWHPDRRAGRRPDRPVADRRSARPLPDPLPVFPSLCLPRHRHRNGADRRRGWLRGVVSLHRAWLRFGQGLGVGGEWAGAVLLATEHAPARRRGYYASYPIIGVAIGFLLANASLLALTGLLADAALRAWGWRIPFLASMVLIAIGLYVRVSLAETPAFRHLVARGGTVRVPVRDLLRHRWPTVLLAVGATVLGFALVFLVTSYGLAYGAAQLHLPLQTMIYLAMLSYGTVALGLPAIGSACDRWGRRRVCLIASGLAAGWAYPFVALLASGQPILILVAFTVSLAIGLLALVTMGAYLPELFDTQVRYTGAAISFNLAGLLGGGLVPLAATALSAPPGTGSPWPVAVLVLVLAVVVLACLAVLPETAPLPATAGPSGVIERGTPLLVKRNQEDGR